MGHHRADRRGPRRSPTSRDKQYAGRRVAGRVDDPAPRRDRGPGQDTTLAGVPAALQVDLTHHFNDLESTAPLPLLAADPPGKRKAVKHAGSRGPLFKILPTAPVAVGVTTIAIAVGGAVTATGPELAVSAGPRVAQASALSGIGGVGTAGGEAVRKAPVSRDSPRETLDQVSDSRLVAAAEKQARQRDAALGQLAQQAEQQAEKIADNQWVYPLEPVVLTARYGQYGLWASYHTGLDFNGNTGDQITAVAGGVVTSTGYEGAYGNKTVITLDDGTEIWYAHQTSYFVTTGDTVRAGDVIGTVGATGNVTGSHLHLEVRPGGGDPVDPYAAMQVNGLF